ncbi:MAG: efflux RND transporter periplasmic adaptor subunit [Alphaproteobacteria bacterium]|uniref:Efflux RND transporter periplasmic adaptor subunit n=1 Tax=Candidatus Nitrobium versatile TaxID=2884831 RepID=A0A953M2V0_9BACT|nr:efflux RND transporter periplasmic adaptor subunit [Candidatus Nitrobium versatile]
MKKKWGITIVVTLAVLAGAALAYRQLSAGNAKETGFLTEAVRKRDIASSVQSTGVIRAKIGAEVKVGARISGRVEKLFANIGDVVKKGQVIARLEQEDLRAKVNEAKMNLKVAEANLDLARKNLQRMQNLYAKDFVSRDKVDVAERDYRAAEAQAHQIMETIRYNEAQMSYATIVAPISGVIASVATQQGETVSASSLNVPTFVTIVDLNRLEVHAYVDETDIGKVKPGLEATFTVDSLTEKDFRGRVSAIYPKATLQDNVVYYITIISIEDPKGSLKPDMTVTATIYLNKKSGVLAVPSKAIKREGGRKAVQVLENGTPVQRFVRTGWKDGSHTEILEGLKEGELVITGETTKAEKE